MKKFLSLLSALALVAVLFPSAQAAGLTDAVATYTAGTKTLTVTSTLANAINAGGTIRVVVRNASTQAAFDFSANNVASAQVGGAGADTISGGTTNNGVVTITDADGTAAGSKSFTVVLTNNIAASNTALSIDFETFNAAGAALDFGAAVVAIGTSNEVTVTATVEPTLSMALSSNSIALGTLTPAAVSTATNTVTIKTNAVSGYTLQALANDGTGTGAGLKSTTGIIPSATGSTIAAGTSGFGIYVSNLTATAAAGTNANTTPTVGLGNGTVPQTTALQTVSTGNGTTDGSVSTVTYKAAISAVQPSGNYSTTVTYAVTGQF